MKFTRIFLFAIITIVLTNCTTQKQNIEHNWKVYAIAFKNGDLSSATAAVNTIYAYDTTNQSAIDTLSKLYYILGNYYGAYQLCEKITNKNDEHKLILAESALQIGNSEASKKYFIELNDSDSTVENLTNKYKLSTLYFNDEEFEEALHLLSEITNNEKSLEQTTRVNMENNSYQDVSLYAASWNFAGYIQSLSNDFETAEKYYDEALRAEPNFVLAKNNKVRLKDQKAESIKVTKE